MTTKRQTIKNNISIAKSLEKQIEVKQDELDMLKYQLRHVKINLQNLQSK